MIRSLAAAALAAFALTACEGACETTLTERIAAPGELHEVRVWQRSCGATTAYSWHFEIAETATGPGSVAHRERVFLIGEGAREDYAIAWVRPRALTAGLTLSEDRILKTESEIEIGEAVFAVEYRRPD